MNELGLVAGGARDEGAGRDPTVFAVAPGAVVRVGFLVAPRFFASISPARARVLFHVLALAVLLAGYSGAALAWRAQNRIDQENAFLEANDAGQLSTADSRQGSQQLEEMYGKGGMLAASWMDWARGLTRGKGLAKTLVVVSSAAAIGCFVAAGRLGEGNG